MFIRIMRASGLLMCAALLLGTSQCQKNVANPLNFVTNLSVLDANGNPAGSFSRGQSITLQLTVRNRSNGVQTLWFNTGEQFNFVAVNAGTTNVLWTSDNGGGFTQAFTNLTFQPGQSQTFTVTWNQTDNLGQLISSGNYEVFGGLTVFNTAGAGSPVNNADAMAIGAPAAVSQFTPSQYRSSLTEFSIQ